MKEDTRLNILRGYLNGLGVTINSIYSAGTRCTCMPSRMYPEAEVIYVDPRPLCTAGLVLGGFKNVRREDPNIVRLEKSVDLLCMVDDDGHEGGSYHVDPNVPIESLSPQGIVLCNDTRGAASRISRRGDFAVLARLDGDGARQPYYLETDPDGLKTYWRVLKEGEVSSASPQSLFIFQRR